MNTATFPETQALQETVTTPVVEAVVTATYRLLLIPLSQLRPSSRNVDLPRFHRQFRDS
jgi:hypothetical protein